MKKINSIDYGGKIIGVSLIFLGVIPGCLFLVNHFVNLEWITMISVVSLVIGILIEIGFGVYLTIELQQDRIINDYYSKHPSSTKMPQEILDERRYLCKFASKLPTPNKKSKISR